MNQPDINVLHGTFYFSNNDIQFFFWGETSKINKKRGIHPFSLSGKIIKQLMETGGIIKKNSSKIEVLNGSMPTINKFPVPSEDIEGLVDINSDTSSPKLKEWNIEGISIKFEDALQILPVIEDYSEAFITGCDVKFWKSLDKFFMQLISSKKFLPAINENSFKFISEWVPLIDGNDLEELKNFEDSMPGACLIFNSSMDRESVGNIFIKAATDKICREFTYKMDLKKKFKTTNDITKWALSLGSRENVSGFTGSLALQKISSWSRKIRNAMNIPFRVLLYVEPPKDRGDWELKLMMQSKQEPSLVIPFSQIWNINDESRDIITRYIEYPEEFMLQSIGMIESAFPELHGSLNKLNPSEFFLNTDDMYIFIDKIMPELQKYGFSFMFPKLEIDKSKRPMLKMRVSPVNSSTSIGAKAIVRYNPEIIFDGKSLTEKELSEIASLKSSLVQIHGKWVEIDREKFNKMLSILKEGGKEVPVSSILKMELSENAVPLEISGSGWVGNLLNRKNKIREIKNIPAFKGKLRNYQYIGVSWLKFMTNLGFGCCLADDMGLGKTIEIIAFLLDKKIKGKTLIVCPTSVISNWYHELTKFSPSFRVYMHNGLKRLKDDEFIKNLKKYDIVITSYPIIRRDIPFISKINWEGVISDESQYIKTYYSKQSRAIRNIKSDYKIALTGTPVENNLYDLWSIFEFLNPSLLGNEKFFREHFVIPVQKDNDQDSLKTLSKIVSPFILRRVKTDKNVIDDLPEKEEIKTYIPITEEQATLYEAFVKAMEKSLEGADKMKKRGIVLSTIMKLKRLLDHPSLVSGDQNFRVERSEKLVRLLEMVSEIVDNHEKVVVFTQYVETGKIIKESIQKKLNVEAYFLSGSTPGYTRENMINSFQDINGPMVFIISLKAGGSGINLTAANNVIHFDRWWNPSVEDQATDRVYRIGQSKKVNVYKFISTGTIEENIDNMINSKKDLREKVIGTSGEAWITELSTDQLKNIFTLRKEIIAEVD